MAPLSSSQMLSPSGSSWKEVGVIVAEENFAAICGGIPLAQELTKMTAIKIPRIFAFILVLMQYQGQSQAILLGILLAALPFSTSGSRTLKVAPFPYSESTHMRPPRAFVRDSANVNPTPVSPMPSITGFSSR